MRGTRGLARRAVFLVGAAFVLATPVLRAQLVPITRCNSAIPCNIPYGIRPADAAGWTPGSNVGQGNTALSMSTNFTDGLMPKIDKPPVSEDPVEAAARMYVRKYPAPATTKSLGSSVEGRQLKPTPTPTPQPLTLDP